MKDKTIPARLIYRKIEGRLSAVEEERFETWLKEGREHREYYERMRSMYQQENMQEVAIGKIQDAWEMFEKRVQGRLRMKRKRYWMWGVSVAASVVVVFCLIIYYHSDTGQDVNIAVQNIVPGQYNAILEMADGATYHLGGQQGSLQEKTGRQIKIDTSLVSYLPVGDKQETPKEVVYNKLSIPRGGEYRIELEDGTKIWMNSESRLRYPVAFFNDTREVYLEGEAYFEVAKDPECPFFVEMEGVEVRVYGTSFNVNTHQKGCIQTVLVKGSIGVKVLASGTESVIKPGQMAEFKQGNTKVDVKEVNVAVYTDWKDGIFRFENQRLEDILTVLSNWYDVDVFYQTPSVKELHFSGYMERYKDVRVILEAITLSTGVTFSIQGKTIIVSK